MNCKDVVQPLLVTDSILQQCTLCSCSAWGLSWNVDTHNITCRCAHTPTEWMNKPASGASYSWPVLIKQHETATVHIKSKPSSRWTTHARMMIIYCICSHINGDLAFWHQRSHCDITTPNWAGLANGRLSSRRSMPRPIRAGQRRSDGKPEDRWHQDSSSHFLSMVMLMLLRACTVICRNTFASTHTHTHVRVRGQWRACHSQRLSWLQQCVQLWRTKQS